MRDEDLPALITELAIPGIVDVHVHFMAPQVMRKVWAYFDAAGPLIGRPWPITYRTSDEDRIAHLRSMGVRHFSSLSYAHRAGVAEFLNAWTNDFADRVPDTVRSATFYPEPEAARYVPAEVARGVQVFKAHLQVGAFAADDPLLDPVWSTLEESGTPIVIHAGSGPAPGEFTGPQGVERVLQRWPELRLVIAHLGMPESVEFLDLAARFRHVHLDTTMAFVDFFDAPIPDGVPQRLVDLADRIVFGTDFPNIPYRYAHQIEVLQRLDLGDDWLRGVLWTNPIRLLGLGTPR